MNGHFKTIVRWAMKIGIDIDKEKLRDIPNKNTKEQILEWDMFVIKRNRVMKKLRSFIRCTSAFVVMYDEVKYRPGNTMYLEAKESFNKAALSLLGTS
jgi:hypothetical protein